VKRLSANSGKPAHNYEFQVVWRGQHWLLASLSWHLKQGVDPTGPERILFDAYHVREVRAPMSEVHISGNPLPRR